MIRRVPGPGSQLRRGPDRAILNELHSSQQPGRGQRKACADHRDSGQDGSYLAELLLAKGYEVHGIVRRSSSFNTSRIAHIYGGSHPERAPQTLHYADLTDGRSLHRVLEQVKPDEVYNLAGQSHVRRLLRRTAYTADVVAMGTLRLLDAVRDFSTAHGARIRFYQAGSSEMFGSTPGPQDETSPFRRPRSACCAVVQGRRHTCSRSTISRPTVSIVGNGDRSFNHESPRRGEKLRHAKDHARRSAASRRACRTMPLSGEQNLADRELHRKRAAVLALADDDHVPCR